MTINAFLVVMELDNKTLLISEKDTVQENEVRTRTNRGCFGWLFWAVLALLLIFSNPDRDAHVKVLLNRTEKFISIMQAEGKKIEAQSGGRTLMNWKDFNEHAEETRNATRNDSDRINLLFFSIGDSGYGVTIGVLGMVFDISSLFKSDQEIRDQFYNGLTLQ